MWPFNKTINGLKNRLHLGWEVSWIALAFELHPNGACPLSRQKIILGETRAEGVRGLLTYCSNSRRSHDAVAAVERLLENARQSLGRFRVETELMAGTISIS
jgi:hypothetical protein